MSAKERFAALDRAFRKYGDTESPKNQEKRRLRRGASVGSSLGSLSSEGSKEAVHSSGAASSRLLRSEPLSAGTLGRQTNRSVSARNTGYLNTTSPLSTPRDTLALRSNQKRRPSRSTASLFGLPELDSGSVEAYRARLSSYPMVREVLERQDSLFDSRDNQKVLVAATKAKLLELVLGPDSDPRVVQIWMNTFNYVISANEWLGLIVDAFGNPKEGADDGVRGHAVSLMRKWIKERFHDFLVDEWLMDGLVAFVGETLPSAGMLEDAKVLQGEIHARVRMSQGPHRWLRRMDPSIPDPHIPKVRGSEPLKLLDMIPVEIARQLSLMDHELFHAIPLHELHRQRWTEDDAEETAPHVMERIAFLNDLAAWAATEVVSEQSLRTRTAILKTVIRVAQKCMDFRSWGCGMSLVAGLHTNSVSRLKKTWKGVSRKEMDHFNSITRILTGAQNFSEYRKLTESAEPPCSPYLGVTLRDLTFTEDGNDDKFDAQNELINVDKLRMISDIFCQLQRFQAVPYRFEIVRRIRQYIEEADRLEEDQLLSCSMLCEPPETIH